MNHAQPAVDNRWNEKMWIILWL